MASDGWRDFDGETEFASGGWREGRTGAPLFGSEDQTGAWRSGDDVHAGWRFARPIADKGGHSAGCESASFPLRDWLGTANLGLPSDANGRLDATLLAVPLRVRNSLRLAAAPMSWKEHWVRISVGVSPATLHGRRSC